MSLKDLFDRTEIAIESKDWFLANTYLQELLGEKHDPEILEKGLKLALTVLEESDFKNKWHVAKLFPQWGESVITPLITMLQDESINLEQRCLAGRILGEFKNPIVIESLVNCLQDTEEEELTQIIGDALANLGENSIVVLSELLESSTYRLTAVKALIQIRDKAIIDPLLSVVNDPSPEIRHLAISALSNFQHPPILKVLLSALQDLSSKVRKSAILGLGLWSSIDGNPSWLGQIEPLLYDFNLEVCQKTALTLSRFKTDFSAQLLYTCLTSPATPMELQVSLIQALIWLDIPLSWFYLKESYPQLSELLQMQMIQYLGRINDIQGDVVETLLQCYALTSHFSTDLKLAYIQALRCAKTKTPEIKAILSQWQEDSDLRVKIHVRSTLQHF